jgi:hypothetical protein
MRYRILTYYQSLSSGSTRAQTYTAHSLRVLQHLFAGRAPETNAIESFANKQIARKEAKARKKVDRAAQERKSEYKDEESADAIELDEISGYGW